MSSLSNLIMMGQDFRVKAANEKLGQDANPTTIGKELQEVDMPLFQSKLKLWDQACQMRKWISTAKLEISERIEKEED